MANHYHLFIETPDTNLSEEMRQLNGIFSQVSYLLELTRYVVLNPVRAKLVAHPGEWSWSSFAAMVGDEYVPDWLTTDALLAQFAAS